MPKSSYRIVILGAGTGGISAAARLRPQVGVSDIAIVDAAETHYYQPLWTLVGGGIINKEASARPMANYIPDGVDWVHERMVRVDPSQNSVLLSNGSVLKYDFLIVATGLRLLWETIDGLSGHLGKDGICTIYEYDQVDTATRMIQEFKGGTALFIMPPVPIKCAGAPQKIMYLAEEIFRENGVRDKSRIIFTTNGKAMFGLPIFAQALDKVAKRKGIEALFSHRLVAVDPARKSAIFDVTHADGSVTRDALNYDLLHVVPPMAAHAFINESGLANTEGEQKGWLAVDRGTLQHLKYPNIFGIGDVTGVPNSKTGAAIRKQAPVVVENLLNVMKGQKPQAQYDGYSSCPLITEKGKVILAEFGYDSKLMPTFPLDPTVERRSMWFLKRYFLPVMYWYGMLRGRA